MCFDDVAGNSCLSLSRGNCSMPLPPPQPRRGLVDMNRRVIGCHLTQETRVQTACRFHGRQLSLQTLLATAWDVISFKTRGLKMHVYDVAGNVSVISTKRTEGLKRMYMTWRAMFDWP